MPEKSTFNGAENIFDNLGFSQKKIEDSFNIVKFGVQDGEIKGKKDQVNGKLYELNQKKYNKSKHEEIEESLELLNKQHKQEIDIVNNEKTKLISDIKQKSFSLLMSFGIKNYQYNGYPIDFKNIFDFNIQDLYSMNLYDLKRLNINFGGDKLNIEKKIKENIENVKKQDFDNKSKLAELLRVNIEYVDEMLIMFENFLKMVYKKHLKNIYDSLGEGTEITFENENDFKFDNYSLSYRFFENNDYIDNVNLYSILIPSPIFTNQGLNYFEKLHRVKSLINLYPNLYKALSSGRLIVVNRVFDEIINKARSEKELIKQVDEKNNMVLEFLKGLKGKDLGYPDIELITDDYRVNIRKKSETGVYFTIPKYIVENGKIQIANNVENLGFILGNNEEKIFQIKKLIEIYLKKINKKP